jgi:predicted RNase H-like nuclease
MLFIGVDLAWGEGSDERPANRSGVVALEPQGKVRDAGWTRGIDETVDWMDDVSALSRDALAFVDAPLVIKNAAGQRRCETEVGQRCGRYWFSANRTNLHSKRKAGTTLLAKLTKRGWSYHDGVDGPPKHGRQFSECHPYTTWSTQSSSDSRSVGRPTSAGRGQSRQASFPPSAPPPSAGSP